MGPYHEGTTAAKSKGQMPKASLIPAAIMLLAKICEFLDKTKDAPVDDKVFADASHIVTVALMAKFDKKYADNLNAQGGAPAEQQPAQMQQPPAQGGALGGSL